MKTREEIRDRVDELVAKTEKWGRLTPLEQVELSTLDWVLGG